MKLNLTEEWCLRMAELEGKFWRAAGEVVACAADPYDQMLENIRAADRVWCESDLYWRTNRWNPND